MSVMTKTFGAGSDIDSRCGKCSMELAHVIIAMDGARPAMVQCKTCQSKHKYRGEVGKPKKKTPVRKTPGTRRTAAAKVAPIQNFDMVMSNRDISQSRPYRASQAFKPEDVVDHKTFGLGVVMKELSGNKIEVCFQAGNKILVHNR